MCFLYIPYCGLCYSSPVWYYTMSPTYYGVHNITLSDTVQISYDLCMIIHGLFLASCCCWYGEVSWGILLSSLTQLVPVTLFFDLFFQFPSNRNWTDWLNGLHQCSSIAAATQEVHTSCTMILLHFTPLFQLIHPFLMGGPRHPSNIKDRRAGHHLDFRVIVHVYPCLRVRSARVILSAY